MKYFSLLIFVLYIKSGISIAQSTLVQTGSTWKYFDQGSLNNTNWKNNSYNDNSWASGPSELGYGDGDEATLVGFGGNSSNKYITTYFRRNFDLTQAVALACSVKIDDGVVVYLNGSEVFRNNMPAGNISFSTLALNGNNENAWFSFEIPVSMAINGTNQLAVEIHQNSPSSSDMSFDFRMVALPSPPPPPAEGVYINEIMASNSNTIDDATGSSSDWIEIFNNTNQVLNLNNYYLTDDKNNLTKFRFSGSINIPANSYKIIWASGEINRGSDHTSWSLSANGEFAALVLPDGQTIVDSLSFPKQRTDVSYGRMFSNIDSLVYFSPASPQVQNIDVDAYLGFLDPPTFSHVGGFYNSNFNLSISSGYSGATIYYTKDGSNPSASNLIPKNFFYKNNFPGSLLSQSYRSFLYNNPISITDVSNLPNSVSLKATQGSSNPTYFPNDLMKKANVIKAYSTKPGFLPSKIHTNTYFILPSNLYTLPVVSVTMPEADLFDFNKGFYTPGYFYENPSQQNIYCPEGNYNQKSEIFTKYGNFEYFENGVSKLNENIKLKIHGGCSRQSMRKSLRIYSDNFFDYPIFQPQHNLKFETLILRNSGNETNSTMFRDAFYHDVVRGLDFGIQENKTSISFINGEYWGLINIRERIDENYINQKFGLDPNKIDLVHIQGGNPEIESGSISNYTSLYNFINTSNFLTQNNYDSLLKRMDIDNFIDYHVAQIFAANNDWPVSNVRLFRNNDLNNLQMGDKDGKWRFILFDIDMGLGYQGGQNFNMLDFLTDNSNNYNFFFKKLIVNNTFKDKLINRYADLLNSYFLSSRTVPILNNWKNLFLPEISRHWNRWTNVSSEQNWLQNVTVVQTFLQNRPSIQKSQLLNKFQLQGTYLLTVNSNNLNQGYIRVNTIDILPSTPGIVANPTSWTGEYFDNIPINIIAKPKKGYKFSHWIHNGQTLTDSIITINTSTDKTYTAFFEVQIVSDNPFPLAYNLNNCTYSFLGWPSSSPVGSYPANMQLVYFNATDPTLSAEIEGFTNGGFDGTSRTRMNGLNQNGLSFINTGSSAQPGYTTAKLGGAILALNTQGVDTVKIKWTGRTIVPNSRKYGIRLLYREGDILPFQDFNPPIEYLGNPNVNDSLVLQNLFLPHDLINKPYIQLLWRYYFTGNGSGARDQLAIDDVVIKVSKRHAGTIGNVAEGNPAYYYLTNQIANSNMANYQAHHSITMNPGFEINSGSVFSAKIEGCENE
jgi:hypothetical protein